MFGRSSRNGTGSEYSGTAQAKLEFDSGKLAGYVDFKTQKRTPKMSAHWFREAASRNTVV